MDKQEKELEEILRMFDKAPSPSSENSVQNQAQQNNKQLRQIPQRQSCSQQTVHSSKQSSTKKHYDGQVVAISATYRHTLFQFFPQFFPQTA